MPRPISFGAPAARKKRARKPCTLQRTTFNTFISFIVPLLCLVRSSTAGDTPCSPTRTRLPLQSVTSRSKSREAPVRVGYDPCHSSRPNFVLELIGAHESADQITSDEQRRDVRRSVVRSPRLPARN